MRRAAAVAVLTTPKLSPTEDLILTLLVSRRRLGERVFRVDTRNGAALKRLAEKGLVHVLNRDVENAVQVSLTERGLVLGLDPDLTEHLEPETCRSFYIGPRTNEHRVDCDKKRGHRGKNHRHTFRGVCTGDEAVEWTDDEAEGLASSRYGDDMRHHQAERDERLRAAITELRPTAAPSDYARFL